MQADAGSATLLRPETMTASAWLHMYHQIITLTDCLDNEAAMRLVYMVGLYGIHAQLR